MSVSRLFARPEAPVQTVREDAPPAEIGSARSGFDNFDRGQVPSGTPANLPPREPSGSWMGSLVGRLGRIQRSAAAAVLGAVALTTISTGAAFAADLPTPSLTPTHVVQQTVTAPTHVVKSGESMWSIAKGHGLTLAQLVAANPQVKNPALIYPKQVLKLGAAHIEDAPATVTEVVAPQTPAAETASVVAQASADKPDTLGKLWREVRKLTFDLLKDQKLDQDTTFELGEHATVGAGIKGVFLSSNGGSWDRMSFERAQPAGKEVLWLETQGSTFLSAKQDGDALDASGKMSFSFSLLRPHVFDKKNPDPLAAAKDLVEGLYRLPVSVDAALAMQRGSQLTLQADAKVDAKGALSLSTVTGNAKADVSLEVVRGSGSDVDVTYERSREIAAKLDAEGLRQGTLQVGVGVDASRQLDDTYRIDLSTADGRAAYQALMRLRGAQVDALADKPNNGVSRVTQDHGGELRVQGSLRHKPDPTLDAGLSASWQRQTDGDEVSTTLRAAADATIKPEGSEVTTGLTARLERTREPDEHALDLGGGLTLAKPLSEQTELRLSSEVQRTHGVDDWRKLETREGRLAHGGVLSTKLQTADGTPWTVGFDAKVEVKYELQTPIGREVDLPLTGQQMRRAPEGTRFTLTGQGSVGAKAQHKVQRLDLSSDANVKGELEVTAWRGAGDEVRVRLDLQQTRQATGRVVYAPDQAVPSLSGSFAHQATRGKERSSTFNLSLAKANHRAAYDALLKGNLGPALALSNQPKPEWVVTSNNNQAFKLDVGLTEWFGAGLELMRRDIDPKDGRVRWDTERRTFTEQATAAGHKVRWLEGEGALAPKLSYKGAAPVGGALSLRHGFSATQTLRYRTLSPSLDGGEVVLAPAMTAQDALRMPLGAEFELLGKGSVSGFVGLGLGTEWGFDGADVAATASADSKHEQGRTWRVQVERLQGERVQVSYERGSERDTTFEVAARAGVKVDSEQLLGLESAVQQVALLGKVTDKLDSALEKRLSVELAASWSQGDSKSTRVTFELDLARPEVRQAYAGLLKLDASAAMGLAQGGLDMGVEVTSRRDVETVKQAEHLHLDVFGERLYLTDALRQDSTTIDRWLSGDSRTDRSTFREKYEGLLGRKQNVEWEAVRVRAAADPVGKGYYRLTYVDEDPMTSKDELRHLVSLAQDLKAQPVRALKMENGARGLKKLFGAWAHHGKTKVEMDLFFTGQGIDAIRAHDGAQGLQVYGEVAARRAHDQPYGWALPKTRDKAVGLLEDYLKLKKSPFNDHEQAQEERSLEVAYWRLTGNEMWEDREAYEAGKAFSVMVQRMHDSQDPAAWNRAFADLGQAISFDFYDAVAAMQAMSKGDEIVVHNLRMQGRSVDIEMKDEGLVRYPG